MYLLCKLNLPKDRHFSMLTTLPSSWTFQTNHSSKGMKAVHLRPANVQVERTWCITITAFHFQSFLFSSIKKWLAWWNQFEFSSSERDNNLLMERKLVDRNFGERMANCECNCDTMSAISDCNRSGHSSSRNWTANCGRSVEKVGACKRSRPHVATRWREISRDPPQKPDPSRPILRKKRLLLYRHQKAIDSLQYHSSP